MLPQIKGAVATKYVRGINLIYSELESVDNAIIKYSDWLNVTEDKLRKILDN